MKSRLWQHLPCNEDDASALAITLNIHPTVARLLCLRGFGDPAVADRFLNPSLDHLHDPFLLADMDRAVTRLERALASGERIAVHGDYDVDGITSTVILRRALEMLGGKVIHFIPERLRDGYGLQPAAIDRLHADKVDVIVSVDCGIRGNDAAQRARELGIDLIITDHHEPEGTLPGAVAVINPKRHDCSYPDKHLAGVGVALKLVQALCTRAGKSKWLPGFVKIAALGTLADVVPLVGENRVIARFGLESLSRGPHTIGLRSLLEASGLTGKTIDSYQVAFIVAPRVNAAGRMSSPDIATRLLLARSRLSPKHVGAAADTGRAR
jgi:single-stranded-DNA-specific exonuclease